MSKQANNTKTNNEIVKAMSRLLKRKDGVSVAEAVEETGYCKKTVRKYFAELGAKETDYLGYYRC